MCLYFTNPLSNFLVTLGYPGQLQDDQKSHSTI